MLSPSARIFFGRSYARAHHRAEGTTATAVARGPIRDEPPVPFCLYIFCRCARLPRGPGLVSAGLTLGELLLDETRWIRSTRGSRSENPSDSFTEPH